MKTCSKCKVEKDESEFNKSKANKDGLIGYCKTCLNEQARINRSKNVEKYRNIRKKYALNNPEAYKEAQRKYNRNNPEKKKDSTRRSIENISDGYVKNKLRSSIPFSQITPELIEFTRLSIRIKRLIKEKKQCETSTN